MMPLGRTVRLFLVDGSPLGLIVAEIIGWTGKILTFPRGLLPEALKRPEVAKTGIYFLVGPHPENPTRNLVYIGESDDVAKRLKQHDAADDKDFFEQVALLVSKDENLTKSHVRYLESRLIELIRTNGGASLHNGTLGFSVSLPESEQADMEYVLQQLLVLMPALGFAFLQAPPKRSKPEGKREAPTQADESPIFELSFLNGRIQAEAYEAEGQFVVMEGAICRHPAQVTAPLKHERYAYIMNDIQQSLEAGTLVPVESNPAELVRLTREKGFKSPSRAASFVCGNPMSGLAYWKVKGTGQTYGDWRKAKLEATQNEFQPVETETVAG